MWISFQCLKTIIARFGEGNVESTSLPASPESWGYGLIRRNAALEKEARNHLDA